MANRQKSHFGSDGYRELYVKEDALKSKRSYDSPIADKRRASEKEVLKLREENLKLKKKSDRSAKLNHPKGTGKRNIGQSR